MNLMRRKVLETLGITIAICTVAGVFIYGLWLIGMGTNPVIGCWIIGTVVFIGVFAGVYLGKD